MDELTDRERALLDFEERFPVHGPRKVDGMREAFGWSPARYYQALLALARYSQAAAAYAPHVVGRVRRGRGG